MICQTMRWCDRLPGESRSYAEPRQPRGFAMARKRVPGLSESPPKGGKPSAADPIDELLPLAEPAAHEVHFNAAVLEVHQSQLPRESLLPRLRRALEDDAAAAHVLSVLSPVERTVAAVYRRYGGSVAGEVIRIDLMARGLLEIVEKRYSDFYIQRQW